MSELRIITNNVPRDVTEAYELSEDERAEFDYLDWQAIEAGEDSASFVRYKGELHDLAEFDGSPRNLPADHPFQAWHQYKSDTFFSGIVIRYCDDYERVVIGRFYS